MTQSKTLTPTGLAEQLAEVLTNLPPDSRIRLEKLSTGEIAVSYDTPSLSEPSNSSCAGWKSGSVLSCTPISSATPSATTISGSAA